ncbi:PPOX class F420-dependent oxidoreductase [Streptomyces sp. NPDC005408]|uniref:PPOX class F420-dependent oxidoreductase n=1 Tax=Streptomyces sp. NPDC005408 TaxID=3155341 RepID=UPI0033B0EB45
MIAEDFASARYVSVTTFRKDGKGVATPVWFAVDSGELFVWSRSDSWKVKRLGNDSRVVVTVCDARGRIAEGALSTEGTGRLLDDDGTGAIRKLLSRKYTWQFWLVDWPAMIVRRGKRPHTGIAVTI